MSWMIARHPRCHLRLHQSQFRIKSTHQAEGTKSNFAGCSVNQSKQQVDQVRLKGLSQELRDALVDVVQNLNH